jgi:hypothetical protein
MYRYRLNTPYALAYWRFSRSHLDQTPNRITR